MNNKSEVISFNTGKTFTKKDLKGVLKSIEENSFKSTELLLDPYYYWLMVWQQILSGTFDGTGFVHDEIDLSYKVFKESVKEKI